MLSSLLFLLSATVIEAIVITCLLLSSYRFYGMVVTVSVSLGMVSCAHLVRVWQPLLCPKKAAFLPQRGDEADEEVDTDDERAKLNQRISNMSVEGKSVDALVVCSTLVSLLSFTAAVAFGVVVSSSDSVNNERVSRGWTGLLLFGVGTLVAFQLTMMKLELWASGLLNCGCCPRVVAVPTYLLPRSISVAGLGAFMTTGGSCGVTA